MYKDRILQHITPCRTSAACKLLHRTHGWLLHKQGCAQSSSRIEQLRNPHAPRATPICGNISAAHRADPASALCSTLCCLPATSCSPAARCHIPEIISLERRLSGNSRPVHAPGTPACRYLRTRLPPSAAAHQRHRKPPPAHCTRLQLSYMFWVLVPSLFLERLRIRRQVP